jgi:hypothetical protein
MGGGLGRGVEDVYVVLRLQEGWIKGRENGLYPKIARPSLYHIIGPTKLVLSLMPFTHYSTPVSQSLYHIPSLVILQLIGSSAASVHSEFSNFLPLRGPV